MGEVADRNEDGTFAAGKSGNPAGRPKGNKNKITQLQQDLEIAVRENVSSADVKEILETLVKDAKGGSLGAAKLLLDKLIPNAKSGDDIDAGRGGINIIITNATAKAPDEKEVEAEVVTTEENDG